MPPFRRNQPRPLWRALSLAPWFLLTALSAAPDLPFSALPDDPACTAEDRKFMARCYELARASATKGNGGNGALLVGPNGEILCEYESCSATSHDVTKHAETGMISLMSPKLDKATLAAATLYVSSEPCIMCCGSIHWAGIHKFVYGRTGTQTARLRGTPALAQPLQCREVYQRNGWTNVQILGPLMEKEGLLLQAETSSARPAPAKTGTP